DRGQSLEATVEPAVLHQRLEAVDDVGGPGARLLHVIHGDHGLFREWSASIGEFDVRDPLAALARRYRWLDHLGVPPGALLFGHPTGAVAVDAEQPLDRGRPEPLRDLELDERHDRHLVLAEAVIRWRRRHADRFADGREQLERDPGPVADLPERFGGESSEPLV